MRTLSKLLLSAAFTLGVTAPVFADALFFTPTTNGNTIDFVSNNLVVGGPINPLFAFTGWISTTTLTTSVGALPLSVGQTISGPGVTAGTTVSAVLTQNPGLPWTYTVNNSQTVGSATNVISMTASQPTFTFSGSVTGYILSVNIPLTSVTPVIPNGTIVSGSGVTANSIVTANLGNNNYQLSQTSSATGSITLTATLTASSIQDASNVTAPVYASGGCTTTPAFGAGSIPYSWTLTNGASGCSGNTITLTLPAAAHKWVCTAHDVTSPTTTVVEQSAAGSTTSVVFTNYTRTTGAVLTWVASDVIIGSCIPY